MCIAFGGWLGLAKAFAERLDKAATRIRRLPAHLSRRRRTGEETWMR